MMVKSQRVCWRLVGAKCLSALSPVAPDGSAGVSASDDSGTPAPASDSKANTVNHLTNFKLPRYFAA